MLAVLKERPGIYMYDISNWNIKAVLCSVHRCASRKFFGGKYKFQAKFEIVCIDLVLKIILITQNVVKN